MTRMLHFRLPPRDSFASLVDLIIQTEAEWLGQLTPNDKIAPLPQRVAGAQTLTLASGCRIVVQYNLVEDDLISDLQLCIESEESGL